jgi:hypothetical protein
MRYKFNKILTASLMACLILGSFVFNSCKKEDAVSSITLTAFGPSPALRGGEVKFLGTSLDQVTSVVLSDGFEIKEITKTSPTEISVLIPQTAKPGLVVLKTPQGDITTKTPLTFSEPILITTFVPATVTAGDILTINGDYLNLIASVTFKTGVVVDSSKFVSKTRKKIEVRIPVEAQTGKFILSNGAKTPIQVQTLTDLTVTLPTITSLAPNPVKPETALTISGTNFQLVKSISFAGSITVTSFTVNTDKTAITVTVPKNVKEGTIKLTTLSSVDVESALPLNLISPVITLVAPTLVKNGTTLTITGTNLDLATKVTFGGAVDGVIVSQSATKIDVTVPMTALDGTVVLSTNSGKTAESAAITLVKPTFTSFAPLSLVAGDNVTISGTDLDLVKKVDFGAGLIVDVTNASATSFTVPVPMAAKGGKITLVTVNGTQITSAGTLTVISPNKPVITAITPVVRPGKMLTITGTKLNLVESVFFPGNLKAVLYGVRTETSIEVYVPETAATGNVTLTLKAFDGTEVVSPIFTISGVDPVQDPSYILYDFDNFGIIWNDYGTAITGPLGFSGKYYYVDKALPTSWFTLFSSNWGQYNVAGITKANGVVKMDINILDVDPTLHLKFRINNGWYVWNIGANYPSRTTGGWITVTFPLSQFDSGLTDADLATSVVNGAHVETDLTAGWLDSGSTAKLTMAVDNVRFEKITAPAGVFGLY